MPRFSDWRLFALVFTGGAFLVACASAPAASTKKKRTPVDPGEDFFGADLPVDQGLTPTSDPDSGAFGEASERPSTVTPNDGGPQHPDSGPGPSDAGPVLKTYCAGPLKAGDLQIGELMIQSRAGAGDDGEWVEIRSTQTCWLKLKGLVVESPRGLSVDSVTIADDFELGPKELFLVADSADAMKNNALPGKLYAWNATDVLKNDGDTVSVKLGAAVIDTLTYPAFSNLVPGRTVAFPNDCPANVHSDWARWSLSFTVWKLGFKGTPNATNDDIACY